MTPGQHGLDSKTLFREGKKGRGGKGRAGEGRGGKKRKKEEKKKKNIEIYLCSFLSKLLSSVFSLLIHTLGFIRDDF